MPARYAVAPSDYHFICFSFVLSDLFLKGLSHEIDLKNVDKNLQNLAELRDAAGF